MAENTNDSAVLETEEELTSYTTETNAGAGTGTSTIAPGYGTGRRKEAVARVRLVPGTGKWTINGRTLEEYFPAKLLQREVNSPIVLLKLEGKFDAIVLVDGGGTTGQAGAIRLGVARALNAIDRDANRAALKKAGFLTRDARVVERKKAGLHKARRAVLEALKLTASFIRNPSETYGLRGVSSLLWASVRCVGRNGLVRCVGRIWQTLQMKHPHLPHSRPTRYRTFRMGRLRIDACADSLRRPLRVNPSKSASSR